MSPLIIKILAIGCGSITGAGGIYFSYPHIANLISPEEEVTPNKGKSSQTTPVAQNSGGSNGTTVSGGGASSVQGGQNPGSTGSNTSN